MEEPFKIKKICTNLRPAKVVTLIPKGFDWRKKCLKIIEFHSQVWGGARNFIIPTNDAEIDEKFWVLLEKFDPDYFYIYNDSEGKIVHDISKKLKYEILKRLNPFYSEDIESIKTPIERLFVSSGYPLTHLPDIIPNTDVELPINNPIIDYPVTKRLKEYLELMGYSVLGKMTNDYLEQIKKINGSNIAVDELIFDKNNITQFYGEIWEECSVPFPYSLSMLKLNHYLKGPSINSSRAPLILVIGSNLEDFCFYYNLSRLRNDVLWVPFSLFQASMRDYTNKKGLLSSFIPYLISVMGNVNIYGEDKNVILTSFSKSSEDLIKIKKKLNDVSLKFYNKPIEHLSISFDINKILTYNHEVFEYDNYSNCYTEQFIDNKSVNPIKTPIPLNFKHRSFDKHYWITEISIKDYKLPQVSVLSDSIIARGYSEHEIRISKNGISYFCPNTTIIGNHPIDKSLLEAHIYLFEPFEIFEKILGELGFSINFSDKGNFERESIRKFGSLEQIAKFLLNEKNRTLFDQFVKQKKKNKSENHDEGRYLKDNRRYMDLNSIKKIIGGRIDSLKFIDDFIENKIFHRGFIFKCESCRYSAWYDVKNINSKFTCNACGKSQYYKSNHLISDQDIIEPKWFYKLDEIIYKGYINDMIVPLLTLNKLDNLSNESFLHVNEIEIWKDKSSKKKPEIELDICCISDGKIIIGECKKSNKIEEDVNLEKKKLTNYKYFYKQMGAKEFVLSTFNKNGWSDRTIKNIEEIFGDEINYTLLNKKDLLS